MDYINVPRSLVFKDRDNLNDFGVQIPGTVNHYLFSKMREMTLLSTDGAKDIALQCFNNAYYICTLIQFEEFPDLCVDKYEKKLLEVKIPYLNDVCAASMALVCELLPAYDDKWKQKDNYLIKKIQHWFSHNKWMNDYARDSFDNIIKMCNTEGLSIPPGEFAPRDIIEAIENASEDVCRAGVEYICERLNLLDNRENAISGANSVIARLNDHLQELYEDYGYDPNTNSFEPAEPGTFGDAPDFEECFWRNVNPIKEAIEYFESHFSSDKKDKDGQIVLTKDKQPICGESHSATLSQSVETIPLQKRIAELEKLNAELYKDNLALRDKLGNTAPITREDYEELKNTKEMLDSVNKGLDKRLNIYESILGTEEELSMEKKFSIAERIIFCSALLGCGLGQDAISQMRFAKLISKFSGDKIESIRATISDINGRKTELDEDIKNGKMDRGAIDKKYMGITNAALNVYKFIHAAVNGATIGGKTYRCQQAMENIEMAYHLKERDKVRNTDGQPPKDFELPPDDI